MMQDASRKLKIKIGRHKILIILPLQLKKATLLVKHTPKLTHLRVMGAVISPTEAIMTLYTPKTSLTRCRSRTSQSSGSILTAQAV